MIGKLEGVLVLVDFEAKKEFDNAFKGVVRDFSLYYS
jgi:hypothetical protein